MFRGTFAQFATFGTALSRAADIATALIATALMVLIANGLIALIDGELRRRGRALSPRHAVNRVRHAVCDQQWAE
jgi:hypothetical protein